jgi:hypothetical protein
VEAIVTERTGPDEAAVHGLRSAVWQPEAAAQIRADASRYLDAVSGMPFLREVGARTLELLALVPGETVLDVGCGNGVFLPPLAGSSGPAGASWRPSPTGAGSGSTTPTGRRSRCWSRGTSPGAASRGWVWRSTAPWPRPAWWSGAVGLLNVNTDFGVFAAYGLDRRAAAADLVTERRLPRERAEAAVAEIGAATRDGRFLGYIAMFVAAGRVPEGTVT